MATWRSQMPELDIPNVSITDYVLGCAERLADKVAFVDGDSGATCTYAELANRIRKLAGGLRERGVGPGTTWALMAPNAPNYAVAFHGLAYAGATITTLNPTYQPHELAFQLKDSGASAVVTVSSLLGVAQAAAQQAGIERIVLLDGGDAAGLDAWFGAPLSAQVDIDLAEHVAVLPYSSGTTGFPKGVMLTHRNLVANLEQCLPHLPLGEDEVCYAVLPFFHIYGMQILMNLMLSRGGTVVTAARFDLEQMLRLTQTHRVTRLFVVPPIVLALAKHPLVDQYDLSSVRQLFSGAAPLSGELAAAAAARLGCETAQGYGMTELSPVTHIVPQGADFPGSVGTLVAGTEARLVDPKTGDDAPEDGEGELWIRGPQVMKGYLNNADATAYTIDADGWLHTGDIARVDAEGRTYIVDRLKELIKYKGFQVPPAELEAVLVSHPQVADAAVIGVPDEEAGELVKAFVVRVGDAELPASTLQAYVADRVASYKRIHAVAFVDAIPKSASGKILRRELRASRG